MGDLDRPAVDDATPDEQRIAMTLATVLDRLACPRCHGRLGPHEGHLRCESCRHAFPVAEGVADLRPGSHADQPEYGDWIAHWAESNQASLAQRFFSLYRKAVFARTVAWHLDRFFPGEGVFVEAGSGTAETSMRIDKRAGRRVLVAVDLILPVVARSHGVMDVRIAADCFRLPFADGSVDGLWNVGVMEHFEHDRIDGMLREFRRILRPGAPLCLLWPATDSLPQKGLRAVEWIANRVRDEPLRFHPGEISKLRSSREGNEVLARNALEPVFVDWGLRSLMAFKTVVGRRPA